MNTPSPARRLIDPVHFFNSVGVSVLTARDQSARINTLEKEKAELQRKLKSAIARIQALTGEDVKP